MAKMMDTTKDKVIIPLQGHLFPKFAKNRSSNLRGVREHERERKGERDEEGGRER